MLKKLLCLAVIALICGCSTSKTEVVSSETAMSEQSEAEKTPSANAVDLPYTFSLSGEKSGDDTIVTLHIEYHILLPEAPVLSITPHGDTMVKNMRLVTKLEMPDSPGLVTKTIILSGTEPGIDVSIAQKSNFMGVELHDSWPPKPKKRDLEPETQMTDLPAQIEVEGISVQHGVDVHP